MSSDILLRIPLHACWGSPQAPDCRLRGQSNTPDGVAFPLPAVACSCTSAQEVVGASRKRTPFTFANTLTYLPFPRKIKTESCTASVYKQVRKSGFDSGKEIQPSAWALLQDLRGIQVQRKIFWQRPCRAYLQSLFTPFCCGKIGSNDNEPPNEFSHRAIEFRRQEMAGEPCPRQPPEGSRNSARSLPRPFSICRTQCKEKTTFDQL